MTCCSRPQTDNGQRSFHFAILKTCFIFRFHTYALHSVGETLINTKTSADIFLYRSGIPFPLWDSLKILLASLCMGMAGRTAAMFLVEKYGVVAALIGGMAVSGLVYVAAVALSGCLTREEAAQLPVIGKYLRKFWY